MQHYINFNDYQELRDANKYQQKVIKKLKDYVQLEARTPEEIYVDIENKVEVIDVLNRIREHIGEKRFNILWMRYVDNMSQEEIARIYNRSQNTISELLKRIQKKTINFLENSNISIADFYTGESHLEINSPESTGYPFEHLMSVSNGGEWKILKNGRKRYKSLSTCKIPEYLSYSFKDNRTKCSLCILDNGEVTCKRRKEN